MSIKRATGTSNFAVQAVNPSSAVPEIGQLPSLSEVRPEVPNVSVQNDSYFSRESIGSAKFDTRISLPSLMIDSVPLSDSEGSAAKSMSLSPERPHAIASFDLLSFSQGSVQETLRAVQETLEVANFESALLQADYNFVMDSFESGEATASDYEALEDSATSDFSKINTSVEAIQRLAIANEEFSRNLDVRLSWSSVQSKVSTYCSTFATRFGGDDFDSSFSSINVDSRKDTGSAIVKKIENFSSQKLSSNGSSALNEILVRVKNNDLLFDDGSITGYSRLPPLEKVAVCSEAISKILNNTFTGMTGSSSSLQTTYEDFNIFDPYDVEKDGVKTLSHYSFIRSVTKGLETQKVESFKNTVSSGYREAYETLKRANGVGYKNEICTPLDIYTRLLGKVAESFETTAAAKEANIIANPFEIYDAVTLMYSMDRKTSGPEFSGFIRGLLLTTVLDDSFILGNDSSEEYETVTQTKSQIEDSSSDPTNKTIVSKTGFKNLKNSTVEDGNIYASVFSNSDRVNNFPLSSRKFAAVMLRLMDYFQTRQSTELSSTSIEYAWYLALSVSLSPVIESSLFAVLKALGVPTTIGWSSVAPQCEDLPSGLENLLPKDTTSDPYLIYGNLVKSLQNFSRDSAGLTIASSIVSAYDEIISSFEEATGKKLSDVSQDGKFIVNDGTCTKRALFDILIECFGNILLSFLTPGFYVETKGSAITSVYLSLSKDYSELLTYLENLSKISGSMYTAISNAHAASSLPSDSDYLPDTLAALNTYLYKKHQDVRVAVAAVAGIADVVTAACDNYSVAITSISKDLASAPADAKQDCLNSLTLETASSILLKSSLESGVREPFEESLAIHDVSAASWFYEYYRGQLETYKVCAVLGLPAGFTSRLMRRNVIVDGSGQIVGEELPLSRDSAYLTMSASARSLLRPYDDIVSSQTGDLQTVGAFHPFVSARVISRIADAVSPLRLVQQGSVSLACYDRSSGKWIGVSLEDCINFLLNGASFDTVNYDKSSVVVEETTAKSIIEYHVIDAILKSTIRVVTGIEVSENYLSSTSRTIGSSSASRMLRMLNNSTVFPRGGMTASQFLSANIDGSYSPLPYSKLRGEASNLTNPSDHGLLLKILESGIFTTETLQEKIIRPDPFERVYCMMYDPENFTTSATTAFSPTRSDPLSTVASLYAIRVGAT